VTYQVVPSDMRDDGSDSDDIMDVCEHGVYAEDYCAICEEDTIIITD